MENTYDVIVAGASNSGGMAAMAAAEKGAKVLLIDKMGSSQYLYRSSIAAVDSNAQKKAGIKIDKAKLINFLTLFAQSNVDQRLLWTWVNHSADTVNWLEDNILKPNGGHIMAEPDAHYESIVNTAFPTENVIATKDNTDWAHYGTWMIDKVKELGVTLKYNTKLEKLITAEDGTVTGIVASDRESGATTEYHATKGVILCTGGYGANKELMAKWDPLGLKKNVYSDSPRDDGSGILAGLAVGAARDEEPAETIFDRGGVKPGTKAKEHYVIDYRGFGYFWLGSYPLLKVNLKGERFSNESLPYELDINSASKQPGYLEAVIFNDETLNHLEQFHTLGCSRLGWPGIYNTEGAKAEVQRRLDDGTAQKADTIEELAEKLQLPAEKLAASVRCYNKMCAQKQDTTLGKEPSRLFPVDQAPYYGILMGGRLLATLDGLRINTKMQVINESGDAIPHLYAAGNASGGFFWGSYPDRIPGLACSRAQTFGRLAGQNAAEN
ncbi:FAD-binding protein [Lactobacillus sp. ESL0731]|uniref:FAD-dependent oxidoreductase n=1 Tax=unclassified Lactobacillus TaxID=2620435 RepID=UPI0023F86696|nr:MULTISPECIES: FAD-binding protein [unclassified Lactobacillus]WEV50946.1 FAD-binding protein [Lactobacillus sp. ESL0700]WEV62077.1 FAD-binding protein [Lactobacillus sp. ESL0731]